MLQKLKILILSTAFISSISALNLDVKNKSKNFNNSNNINTIQIKSKFSKIRNLSIISKNKCDQKLLENLELWLRKLDQKIIDQNLKKEVIQEKLDNKLLKLIKIEYLDGIKILISLGAVMHYKKEIDPDSPLIKAIMHYHPSLMRSFLIDRASKIPSRTRYNISNITNISNSGNIYNDYECSKIMQEEFEREEKEEETAFSLKDILKFFTK